MPAVSGFVFPSISEGCVMCLNDGKHSLRQSLVKRAPSGESIFAQHPCESAVPLHLAQTDSHQPSCFVPALPKAPSAEEHSCSTSLGQYRCGGWISGTSSTKRSHLSPAQGRTQDGAGQKMLTAAGEKVKPVFRHHRLGK